MEDQAESTQEVVLVVDDDDLIRATCTETLQRAGYRVLAVPDGREALHLFETMTGQLRCVLLDLTMPYMRGNVVFARMRAIDPRVPILIMSGYSNEQIAREFEAAGVAGFVNKPFTPEEMLRAVGSLELPEARRQRVGNA
jgi:CheY-like chemotaxis protein